MPRTAYSSPRGPPRVPYLYVYERLKEYHRLHPESVRVSRTFLNSIAVNGKLLVPVSKLKSTFSNNRAFQDFKLSYLMDIPDSEWMKVVRRNARLKTYVNRFLEDPIPTGRLKMRAYVGSSDESDDMDVSDDESIFSIDPSNDECDSTNVNLPKPICQGVRRVCRYYDKAKRYRKFDKDNSEKHRYKFNLKYE